MEKLLQYFISETDKKIENLRDDIKGDIKDVRTAVEELSKFKVEMIAGARLTALIVSAICGLLTLVSTVFTVVVMWRTSK